MSKRGLSLLVVVSVSAAVFASSAQGAIRIADIRFDSPGADNGGNSSLNGEWIRIRNTGNSGKTVGGWRIRDTAGHVYVFPSGARIGGGETVKIHTGGGSDSAHHRYWDQDNYVWNNDGDRATLKRPNGRTVDRCSYSGAGSKVTC